MPEDNSEPKGAGHSRRSFLGKLGLAAAGITGASLLLSSLGRKTNKEAASLIQEFPDEHSIFHPARDPRRHNNG